MPFDPLSAVGLVVVGTSGREPRITGTCFLFRYDYIAVTASHCVPDDTKSITLRFFRACPELFMLPPFQNTRLRTSQFSTEKRIKLILETAIQRSHSGIVSQTMASVRSFLRTDFQSQQMSKERQLLNLDYS